MKVRFLGTDACPDSITLRDVDFSKGKAVEVGDSLAAKCLALPYFAEVKTRKKAVSNEQDET